MAFPIVTFHPTKLLVTIILLTLLLHTCSNQRTYRKSCDCEYVTSDGRCAYTLLLPTATSPSSSTCPRGGSTEIPGGNTLGESQETLRHLRNNVTVIREDAIRQSWMLNQLQSAILQLNFRTDVLLRHNNLTLNAVHDMGEGGQGSRNMRENYEEVKKQQEDVKKLEASINSTQADLQILQTQVREYGQSLQGILQEVTSLSEAQTQNQELLQAHTEHLDSLTLTQEEMWVALPCSRKGVLVDGTKGRIADSAITVSSTYNGDHGPEKARIYNTGIPGSWCPSKLSY